MNIVLVRKKALYQETSRKELRVLAPENLVGVLDLTDEDLANVQGAANGGPDFSAYTGNTTNYLVDSGTGLASGTFGILGNTVGTGSSFLGD